MEKEFLKKQLLRELNNVFSIKLDVIRQISNTYDPSIPFSTQMTNYMNKLEEEDKEMRNKIDNI